MIDDLDQGRVMFGVKCMGFKVSPRKLLTKTILKKEKMEENMKDLKNMGNVTEVKVEDNVPDKAVFATNADFDEMHFDTNQTSHSTVFSHNFDQIPSKITIYFTPDHENFYPLMWPWYNTSSGGPVTIKVTEKAITLQIYNGVPLYGVWDPTKGWTTYPGGYWRVLAWK